MQTFQSFEVIVVDDCSTDNSCAVVESYIPKFSGRLRLYHTEKNSGGGGYLPRNLGLNHASGEYVIFLDADDFLLMTALETLYNTARKNDADVIYSSVYYNVKKPNDVYIYRDGFAKNLIEQNFEDKTELTVDNRHKIFHELLYPGSGEGNFRHPWSKFVRRDFLVKNEILFPDIVTGGDCIWVINVYAHARRFLRLSVPLYFYRRYNSGSLTRMMREPEKQLAYWGYALTAFIKALIELTNKVDFLKENPFYCYEALRGGHFNWVLNRTNEAREKLSNKGVYEVLYRELGAGHNPDDFSMPFLFGIIDADRKAFKSDSQTIKSLRKKIDLLQNATDCPIISIIIPLYNAEKFIGEALDSILNQTFKNFEVIAVDDCSTDNSVAVVKNYVEKFSGRLTLASMEKNSGCAPAPRNKGFLLSRGEYIFFMDADDTLTETALEEMYALAKEYDADVVYCEKYYMSTGVGEEFKANIHLADSSIQKPPFVSKPAIITNDLTERIKLLAERRFWVTPWQRLVSRKLLAENQITFPQIIGSDDVVWCFQVLCCAKRFLRVPNICYVRRMYGESFTKSQKSPNKFIRQWGDITIRGLKFADNFMSKLKFFQENPAQRYKVIETLARSTFDPIAPVCNELSLDEIYNIFLKEFADTTGENDVLISFLCTALYNEKKLQRNAAKAKQILSRKLQDDITARIDIKLKANEGDFQILSVSDDKATVWKPSWFQKDGIGYQIQSHKGNIEIVAKTTAEGKLNLSLRSLWVPNPEDNSKRIPYWIYYNKLNVNGKVIFDKLTPAWCDKSYLHVLNVKADEEIKISIEWITHD